MGRRLVPENARSFDFEVGVKNLTLLLPNRANSKKKGGNSIDRMIQRFSKAIDNEKKEEQG